jgi:hypothetical protein
MNEEKNLNKYAYGGLAFAFLICTIFWALVIYGVYNVVNIFFQDPWQMTIVFTGISGALVTLPTIRRNYKLIKDGKIKFKPKA